MILSCPPAEEMTKGSSRNSSNIGSTFTLYGPGRYTLPRLYLVAMTTDVLAPCRVAIVATFEAAMLAESPLTQAGTGIL
jgi:hypothetical protein